jgi:hypothetical protein
VRFDAVRTLLLGFVGTLASGADRDGRDPRCEGLREEIRKFSRNQDRAAENPVILRAAHHYVGRDLEDIPRRAREPAKACSLYGTTSCREATRLDGIPMRAIIIVAMLASRA